MHKMKLFVTTLHLPMWVTGSVTRCWNTKYPKKGGRPGVVVMGGDSCSEGRRFKSLNCILDGHFCCLNCNICLIIFPQKSPKIATFVKQNNLSFLKWPKRTKDICATFVRKCVDKYCKKSPHLVTLSLTDHALVVTNSK